MESCKLFLIVAIGCVLAWISYGDIDRQKIGKKPTFVLFLLALLYRATCWNMGGKGETISLGAEVFLCLMVGFILAGLVELVNLFFFQLKGMGGGDIRLLFVMGVLLGLDGGMKALLVASITALGYALVKWTNARSMKIPMGPFLSLGILVVMIAK